MPAIDPARYEMIKVSSHDGVVTLTLNNPARRNAVTRQMHSELERVWDDVDADDDIRVAILTGEAGTFCAGTDLGVQQQSNIEGRKGRPRTRPARRIFWNMLDCEKPIIAKVRGYAYGLGVNIALACDMVYASETAKFCDSHVKMGIAPGDGGAALWPLLIGFSRAKEFLMTGDPIEAPRAAQMGLINYCLPDAELDAAVDAMAGRLADGAPLAISYGKLSVNAMLKQLIAGAFEISMAYDQLTLYTQDHKEGANAFMQKRKPNSQAPDMSPTDRLLSIEAIKQLKARYFRFVDTKDWGGIARLFAPDAEFTRSGALSVRDPWSGVLHPPLRETPDVRTGREEIVKMIRAAVEHMRTTHHGYTPEIDILDEDRASGIWAMTDEIRDRQYRLVLRGLGYYHETYERGADGWVIKTARIARLQLQFGPTETEPERFV